MMTILRKSNKKINLKKKKYKKNIKNINMIKINMIQKIKNVIISIQRKIKIKVINLILNFHFLKI